MLPKYSRAGIALMAAPLYAGPVLAGWNADPWSEILPFAALFFLMQMLRGIDGKRGDMGQGAFLILMGLAQILVVAVAFGFGHLLMLLTTALALPVWLTIALTAFGAAVGIWRYKYSPAEDQMLDLVDSATQSLESGVSFDDLEVLDQDDPAIDAALSALRDLPPDTGPSDIDPIVQVLEQQVGADGFHAILADIGEGEPQIDLGFLRYLASPAVRDPLTQTGELGFALSCLLTTRHAGTRHELIATLMTLLDENAPPDALPPAGDVRDSVANWPELAPLADQIADRQA